MKNPNPSLVFTAFACLALALPPRTAAQTPPDPIPPRVGPVEAPATLRPPFASEVGRPADRGIKAPLLPGFTYDASFASLKWIPQGPGLTTNGDLNIAPDHPTSGGVSALAPHPTNPDILYIGTVNGGVWRSDNATSANLSWIPLSDGELSLSIGGLALDPTDVSGQTLVAGIGRRSSFGGTGGAQIGLLRTTNGGTNWTRLGATALAGRSIYNLAARGNVILLAVVSTDNGTSAGLYRTTDGGVNFTNMSGFAGSGLPAGAVTHLAADPGNATRFYVHVASTGVYRTHNSGATWVNVSAGMAAANVGQLALAAFSGGGTNVVWAAELAASSRVYRSTNFGANWVQLDSVTANTSGSFNGFTADPANPNLVYLSGLYVRANFPYSGRVVRGDASLSAGNQWVPIASTNGTGNGTAPHTDSRALTFNSAGRLIEGDDGGIYELPIANTGHNGLTSLWRSLNANLQNSEMHSMAYDRLSQVLIGGTQDAGFQEQVRPGQPLWNKTSNGDGGDAAVDVTSLPGRSIRYGSSQNLGGFFRATYTNNAQLSRVFPARTPLGGPPAISGQFVTPIALNAVNPLRLLFGAANGVYESLDQGNTVSRLSTSVANNPVKMAYGGRSGGVTNEDVIYFGSGSSVLQRTNTGGALTATTTAFPGGNVQSIVLNPTNWQIAYVVGTTKVYFTANAGASWTDLTGNLVGVGTFHSVEFLTLPTGNAIVVGTDLGAYIMRTATPGAWNTLGDNLPNAPVFDTQYDPVGNVLAISTFGRGAWFYDLTLLTNVVTTLADSGPGSLRQVIADAAARPGSDTVTFAANLSGGVIHLTSAQLDINDASGALTITASNLAGGIAISGDGARRGFSIASGSTVTMDSLTVSNCLGDLGGGVQSGGNLRITRCTFNGNSAQYVGGVYNYNAGAALTILSSTFSGNSASILDGGLYSSGPLEIRHSTIVSNTSVTAGGGVRFNSTCIFANNLIAGNQSAAQPDIGEQAGNYLLAAYNLVGDGSGSTLANGLNGNLVGTAGSPLNARLGPLRNNGGATPTHLPLGGSPAVDSGDPLLSGYGLTEQRGFPRVANARVDIGAVESSLRTFYDFDNFSVFDVTGNSVPVYGGNGGQWWNSDHRGQVNSALALNDVFAGTPYGTNNYYRLTTPGDPTNSNLGLGLKGDFTVSAWVWPRVIGGWKIVLGTTTTPGGPGTPVFGLLDNHAYAGFWGNDLSGSIAITASQWTHLAWTYNSYGGQMALYVNGQLDNSAVGRTNTTLDGEVLLGFSAAIANSFFQGFIDEFAIFGEALSPSQITALAAPNGILPNAILPAPVLSPGLVTAACGWNVREIYAHTGDPVPMHYDLPSAEHLANTPQSGTVINYSSSVINRLDPNVGLGLTPPFAAAFVPFACNNLTPQGLINGDDDYFALVAATTIHIAAEDDYTFGFQSDDGARLRVKGAVFASSTAIGAGNPATPAHRYDTLAYPANTGNSLTLGVTHLTPGDYDVEFTYWEYGGAAFSEVFAACGAKTALDGSFRLLSPTLFATHPTLNLVPVSPAQVRLTWTPTNSCDHLQSAPNVTGPWTDVPGAVSGQLLPTTGAKQFLRVAQ